MSIATVFIEVCDANMACTPALFALEQTYPGVSVTQVSCGSECAVCRTAPFVFLNGQVISRKSVDELILTLQAMFTWLLPDYDESSTK